MSRIDLNNDWEYIEEYSEQLLEKQCSDLKLKKVRIPHTCKEVPFHYFDEQEYQLLSGYRRIITASKEWKNKRVILNFDGVAHSAEVFLNGEKIADHYCGYTGFSVELTGRLKFEEDNLLVVKVDSRENQNIPPFGFVIDYMTFGGIYREVYLEIKEKTYISDAFTRTTEVTKWNSQKNDKTTINPENDTVIIATSGKKYHEDIGNATVKSTIKINREPDDNTEYTLVQQIIDGDSIVSEKIIMLANEQHEITQSKNTDKTSNVLEIADVCHELTNIRLWSPESPYRYQVLTKLMCDGKEVDSQSFMTAIRSAVFRADGFYLNGKKYKIRGLNRHQSYAYVGYAMPESMQRLDAGILKKELGCNAVRTSHYPQSHHFIDECDKIGLLVFMEIPGWQHIGNDEWKKRK